MQGICESSHSLPLKRISTSKFQLALIRSKKQFSKVDHVLRIISISPQGSFGLQYFPDSAKMTPSGLSRHFLVTRCPQISYIHFSRTKPVHVPKYKSQVPSSQHRLNSEVLGHENPKQDNSQLEPAGPKSKSPHSRFLPNIHIKFPPIIKIKVLQPITFMIHSLHFQKGT